MSRRPDDGEQSREARERRNRRAASSAVEHDVASDRATRDGAHDGPSHEDPRFVAFLDSLVTAVLARSARAIHALLGDPLARGLPRDVREEALAASRAPNSLRAPVKLLWFHHQMAQLHAADAGFLESPPESRYFDDAEDAADRAADPGDPISRKRDERQIDLFGSPRRRNASGS